MYTVISVTTNTPEWLAARRGGLGASDMPVVLGVDPWKSRYQLWAEKAGLIEPDDLSGNEAVQWGHILEETVRKEYSRRSGRGTSNGQMLQSTVHPWALATIDGWTWEGHQSWEKPPNWEDAWPIEIKTTSYHSGSQWENGPPENYVIQVHHQMMVTGALKASIACLIGGQRLVWCDVQRDEQLIRRIERQGADFWRLVEAKTPPEADGSESTSRALKKLFPQDDDQVVMLPATLDDIVDELQQAKADTRDAQLREAKAKNALAAAIGNATYGVLPSQRVVKYRLEKRAGYEVKPQETRVMRVMNRGADTEQ